MSSTKYKGVLSIVVIVAFGIIVVIAMTKTPSFKPAGNYASIPNSGDNRTELLQKFWYDVEANCRENNYGDNATAVIHLDLAIKDIGDNLSQEEGAERFKSVDEAHISELPGLQDKLIRMELKLSGGDREKFEQALGLLCNNSEEGKQVASLFL